MNLDTYITEWLDSLETRPDMYATCPEALETTYIALLTVLRVHRGENPDDPPENGTHRVYQRITAVPYGPQNCIPIWARDGANVTLEDAVEYLKKVRAAVLP